MKIIASVLLMTALPALADFVPVNGEMESPKTLNALVHFPVDYDPGRAEGYPLLIALHGKGKCGDATIDNGDGTYSLDMSILNRAAAEGAPRMIRDDLWDNELPFIVLAPQIPPSKTGNCGMYKDRYETIYDHATLNYNVDLDRVYVTGLSLGGNGAYTIIAERPDTIAAAVPVAAWYPKEFSCEAINHIGVWAFHGDQDSTVGYNSGKHVVDQKLNGCVDQGVPLKYPAKLTSFAGIGHNSWNGAYGIKEYHTFYDNDGNVTDIKHYYLELAYDHSDPDGDAAGNYGGDGYYYHYNEFGRHVVYHWLLSFTKADGTPNNAPVWDSVENPIATIGEVSSLTLFATDADGDPLTLSLTNQPPSFISFSDQGSGQGVLTFAPTPGHAGTYDLALQAVDSKGAATPLDLVLTVQEPSDSNDGYFLNITGSQVSWAQFRLFKESLWSGDYDLTAMGHQELVFFVQNRSPEVMDRLAVYLNDSVAKKDIGFPVNHYATVGEQWTRVSIPLGDFASKGLDPSHFHSFRLLFGNHDSVDLAVDEVKFTGGAEDFVLYGQAHRSAAYRANGALNAAEIEGPDVIDSSF